MPLDNPRAYMKGNGGGAVMLAAKGRMAEMLKKMMAAKLKAKLGYAMGEDDEMQEESKSGEMEMPEEESKSGESEMPEDEMRKLLEMYSKLK